MTKSTTKTRPAGFVTPLFNGPNHPKWSFELVFKGSSGWTGGPISDLSLSPFGDPTDRKTVAQWAAVNGYRLVDEDRAVAMRAEALDARRAGFLAIILANDLLPDPHAEVIIHTAAGQTPTTEAELYATEAADPTVPGHAKVLAWFKDNGHADAQGNPVQ